MEESYEVESRIEAPEEAHSHWLIGAIAVTTALLAVFAVYSSQLAGRAAHQALSLLNEAAILQNQASDQWTFYQAEGIKRHVFEVQRDALRLQTAAGASGLAARYEGEVKRYASAQQKIRADAERFERGRDAAKSSAHQLEGRSQQFNLALAFFQVAIVLCSVAAIIRRPPLWYLGLAGGAGGLAVLLQALISPMPAVPAG
jgi:hypothetical protein